MGQADPARFVVRLPDAAREVGLSPEALRRLCDEGKGPTRYQLTPRIVGIKRCDLDAFKHAPAMPEASDCIGEVYVIRSGRHVKIGYTKNAPKSRLSYLQIGSAEKLTLVATIQGSPALEKRLHVHFADLRANGEWFREEGKLAAWIKSGCIVRLERAEDSCAA